MRTARPAKERNFAFHPASLLITLFAMKLYGFLEIPLCRREKPRYFPMLWVSHTLHPSTHHWHSEKNIPMICPGWFFVQIYNKISQALPSLYHKHEGPLCWIGWYHLQKEDGRSPNYPLKPSKGPNHHPHIFVQWGVPNISYIRWKDMGTKDPLLLCPSLVQRTPKHPH